MWPNRMNPFTITCQSCHAQLKVSQTSLIGKVVACPKCRNKVHVLRPANDPDLASSEKLPADPLATDFDDIEHLLTGAKTTLDSNPANARSNKKRPAKSSSQADSKSQPTSPAKPDRESRSKKRASSRLLTDPPTPKLKRSVAPELDSPLGNDTEATESAATGSDSSTSGPILPTDQWVSPEVKQRKKRLAIVAGSIAGLLICGAIGAAIWNSRGAAVQTAEQNTNQTDEDWEVDKATDKATDNEPASDENSEPAGTSNPVPDDANANPTDARPLPEVIASQPPPISLPGEQSKNDAADAAAETEYPISGLQASPLANLNPGNPLTGDASSNAADNRLPPGDLSPLSALSSLTSELGELSDLLEQRGTSLRSMQDLAAAKRSKSMVGIPKYFVEKPKGQLLDASRQLSLPCAGMRYENVPLSTVLNDITRITGVPIVLDRHIFHPGDDAVDESFELPLESSPSIFNPTIAVELKATDFAGGLDELLAPLGWVKTIQPNGVVLVHVPEEERLVTRTYPLEFLNVARQTDEGKKQSDYLLSLIKNFIEPETWQRENGLVQIDFVGNQLKATNTIMVQRGIAKVLRKIQFSLSTDVENSPNPILNPNPLTPVWRRIEPLLKQPSGLKSSPDLSLLDLVDKLRDQTGVTILLDWNSLAPLGWTPLTRVPGYLNEPTVEEVLEQLARSMNLTLLVLDESTIQLTTFATAARSTNLEVYRFTKLLSGPLNEQQVLRLMTETLGDQLAVPEVRYFYHAETKNFFLLAPQSIQKQVGAVLEKLEKL